MFSMFVCVPNCLRPAPVFGQGGPRCPALSWAVRIPRPTALAVADGQCRMGTASFECVRDLTGDLAHKLAVHCRPAHAPRCHNHWNRRRCACCLTCELAGGIKGLSARHAGMTAAARFRVAACGQGTAFVAGEGSQGLEATRQKRITLETPASAFRCCLALRSRITALPRACHRSLALAPFDFDGRRTKLAD